jgi:hypothetical protein
MALRLGIIIGALTLAFAASLQTQAGQRAPVFANAPEREAAGEGQRSAQINMEKAQQLLDRPVHDEHGGELGRVVAIAEEPMSGELVVIIESDLPLGLGSRHSVTPLRRLQVAQHALVLGGVASAADLERYEPQRYETLAGVPPPAERGAAPAEGAQAGKARPSPDASADRPPAAPRG